MGCSVLFILGSCSFIKIQRANTNRNIPSAINIDCLSNLRNLASSYRCLYEIMTEIPTRSINQVHSTKLVAGNIPNDPSIQTGNANISNPKIFDTPYPLSGKMLNNRKFTIKDIVPIICIKHNQTRISIII